MKKKIAVMLAGVCAFSMLLAGCSGNEASNEYVSVAGYKGIEVAKVDEATKVTDDDVENYINSILTQNATKTEVTDRAIQEGDTVSVDFVGSVDGTEIPNGSGEDQEITVGGDGYIDGFTESLVGHKAGDTYEWQGKFPETGNYEGTEYAGKDVTFAFTVNSNYTTTTPELTDDLVKTLSEDSKTVKEYRAEVKKLLEENATTNYDTSLQDEAWAAVIEKAEVKKYPKGEVKEVADGLIDQYKQAAEYNQVSYEDFITAQMNTTVDEFESQVQEAAKSSVKQNLVAQVIADKEKLTPDEDGYTKEYEKLAEKYGYEDVDALKQAASEEDLKSIVLQDLVKEWLAENCVQVESDTAESDTSSTGTTSSETSSTDSSTDSSSTSTN